MNEVFVPQDPNEDWHPAVGLQKSLVEPQKPRFEQQSPYEDVRQVVFACAPQLPSEETGNVKFVARVCDRLRKQAARTAKGGKYMLAVHAEQWTI